LRDEPKDEAHYASAHLARPGEKPHEDVARQLPAQARAYILVEDLRLEFAMKHADFVGEHDKM
jgi:hypothetical protein